jgi:DNA-binding transcriptional ArsR family regulator
MKKEQRFEAEKLRKEGLSYNEISKKVGVSKSTLSLWLREMPVTIEQNKILLDRRGNTSNRDYWQKKRKLVYDQFLPPLDNPKFAFGVALYWGEGTKWNTSTVAMTNADVGILLSFVRWCEEFFSGEYEVLVGELSHHSPNRDKEIRDYWESMFEFGRFYPSRFIECKSKSTKHPNGIMKVHLAGSGTWKVRQKIQKSIDSWLEF